MAFDAKQLSELKSDTATNTGGSAYVANFNSSSVSVISTVTNTVTTTVSACVRNGSVGPCYHAERSLRLCDEPKLQQRLSDRYRHEHRWPNTVVDTIQGVPLLPEGIAIQVYQGLRLQAYLCRSLGG